MPPPDRSTPAPFAPEDPGRRISLLFDVFVLNQRLRTLLAQAMSGTGLRADEYAVYSLLFEAGPLTPTEMAAQMAMPLTTVLDYLRTMIRREHVSRTRHPRDSRSYQVRLNAAGLRAQRRASAAWNEAILPLEAALGVPVGEVRLALHALDGAVAATLDRVAGASARRAG